MTQTHRKDHVKMQVETEVMQPQAKEEAGSILTYGLWRERGPANTLISDF